MAKEVLLQAACYCGVPAGVDSFRIAREAFAELERGNRRVNRPPAGALMSHPEPFFSDGATPLFI